jgi:hypothetical protein
MVLLCAASIPSTALVALVFAAGFKADFAIKSSVMALALSCK